MALFDVVDDEYHEVGCDNLYIAAKFARAAYNHPKKVKIHGVCRTHLQGFPSMTVQQELNKKNEIEKVRGTVMGAKLVGDSGCPDLLAVSVYDTKPVHFLSMACDSVKWIEKSRRVYDKSSKKMVDSKFLRLNINDDYNNGMGDVDIADQLRFCYRFDHWMRKYKWWHSIFWWGFGVQMVNAYVTYKTYHKQMKSKPMSHFVMYWILL